MTLTLHGNLIPLSFSMIAGAILMLGNSSCVAPTGVQAGNSFALVFVPSPIPSVLPSPIVSGNPTKQVCDPFRSGGVSTAEQGILGSLSYLQNSAPRANNIADFEKYGTPVDVELFFNQLNVPTRMFDQGFQTQNGTALLDPQGNTLYEWFMLHFETNIRLSFADSPGNYQFAVLSDDGSIVQINQGTGYEVLINNDGVTASRLGCATQTVSMDATTSLPMKLDYFQGPRYNIALVLLWRRIPDTACGLTTPFVDPMCGQSGNDVYFDPTQVPSVPTDNWIQLLDRGWNVLNPANFYLPTTVVSNPCAIPTPSPSPSVTPTSSPSTCVGPLCGGAVGV